MKKEWALFDVDFRCAFVMFKFSAECAFLACQWAEMAKKKKKTITDLATLKYNYVGS